MLVRLGDVDRLRSSSEWLLRGDGCTFVAEGGSRDLALTLVNMLPMGPRTGGLGDDWRELSLRSCSDSVATGDGRDGTPLAVGSVVSFCGSYSSTSSEMFRSSSSRVLACGS